MKRPNIFRLESGFSIMEVMIAAGLLGIVTVGVMQVTKNMTKSSKTDAQRVEFAQVINQIQSLLRDEYSCEATLGGLKPTGSGSTVPTFKRKKPDGTSSNVLTAGQAYGTGGTPIFLKKMEIKNYNAASGIAELWVTMNKGRKDFNSMTADEKKTVSDTAYGSAVVPQILKVQVILDGAGNVKDCISDKDDYTSGACGMVDGDWSDKVKCKSINVQGNGIEPSITAETNLHVKSGLNVGSTLSGDPGDGNATFLKNIDVRDKATVKNDTTITTGKLIFNDGDASIAQVAGSNLYVQNKAGTGNANLIVGRTGVARTTVSPTSVTVNKNGTIGAGLALEVIGNTTLTGSGSTTVTLKVGNADIQYNGTNLVLRKPTGGVVQYADGSTIEEVASQGFVNAQLGRALTGDPATLTTILSNLGTLVSGNPVQAIAATTCGFYTNMRWDTATNRCVDNRTTNCGGTQMVKGFNGGVINCQNAVAVNQTCPVGQLFTGVDSNGTKVCSNADNILGNYVDSKVADAIADAAANATCNAKGGWFDKGSGGGRGVCRYSQGCFMSSYQGCYSCPSNIHYNCGSGWNEASGSSCGTWGTLCEGYCNRNGSKACWCSLSSDGKNCGGDNCGGCV